MAEIIKKYGDKIVYISKNNFNINEINGVSNAPSPPPPPPPLGTPTISYKKSNKINKKDGPPSPLHVVQGEGYLNELKNLLSKRKSSKLSILELTKKNKTQSDENPISSGKKSLKKEDIAYIKDIRLGGHKVLAELKNKIKKIE